jgi:hypothetical protein
MTYNLTTRRLEGRSLKNPERLWTRFASFPPIISVKQFRKAQERLAQSTNRRWDKEATIESLRSLLARKGRLTQVSINQAEDTPSVMTVVKHFGSLRAAYAAIGYKPPPRPSADGKYWSNEEILEGLRKLYKAHGYISNRVIDSCPGLPSYDYTRRRFGSISETMRQAGLPVLSDSQIQRRAWEQGKATGCDEYYRGIHWTEANLLRALRQLQKQYGFVSINLLNRNVGTPSANYFVKRFGSLTKARILAKLSDQTHSQIMVSAWKRKKGDNTIRPQPGPRPKLWHRSEDILLGLTRLAGRDGAVSARLIDEDISLPSWATVASHFGSLSAAYRLAGLIRLGGSHGRYGLPPRKCGMG